MSKDLDKVQETRMTSGDQMSMGFQNDILNTDIMLEKVLLQQGLSNYVVERLAVQGDFVKSISGTKIGSPESPIEFIPLHITNEWVLSEKVGQKFEYRRTEPRTAKNSGLPWTWQENGTEWKRTKVMNVFSLLVKDIEEEAKDLAEFATSGKLPSLDKTLLPVVISFRNTSFNAGKIVATHWARAAAVAKYGVTPQSYSLNLSCYLEQNDLGSFYCMDVKPGRQVSKAHLEKALEWVNVLKHTQVKVDDSDDTSSEQEVAQPTGTREVEANSQY